MYRNHEEDFIDFCLLHPGSHEWEIKQDIPIIREKGSGGHELARWGYSHMVVPVGDRFLCWVNVGNGFLFSDVMEPYPVLRYVALPVEPFSKHQLDDVDEDDIQFYRSMFLPVETR